MFNQLVISGLTIGSVYALIALGFSITFTSTKILNFAHGEMAMLGALLGVSFFSVLQLPYPLAMALVMVLVAAIAILFERLVLRPIMSRGGHSHNLIIATLAAAFFFSNAAELIWGKDDLYAKPPFGNEPIEFLGAYFIPQSFLVLAVTIGFLLVTWFFYEKTTLGRSFRAVAINREAASLMSINVRRVMMLTFGLSGVLAANAALNYLLKKTYPHAPEFWMTDSFAQKIQRLLVCGFYAKTYAAASRLSHQLQYLFIHVIRPRITHPGYINLLLYKVGTKILDPSSIGRQGGILKHNAPRPMILDEVRYIGYRVIYVTIPHGAP